MRETVDFFLQGPDPLPCAARWQGYLSSGAWELHSHTYWAQPFPFWHMPDEVVADLLASDCCFIKGDANYRRLLGDRYWDLSLPFGEVVSYWPCPVAPLRTLKAELGCGMAADRVASARERDPKDWMVTGKYGESVKQASEGTGRAGEGEGGGSRADAVVGLCLYVCLCADAVAGVVQFQLPSAS